MRRLALIPLLLAGVLLGGSSSPARTRAVSGTLHGQVGPGFQIALAFDDGSPVTNLPAGTYTVEVKDLAEQHNFHLYGPGVEEKTEVGTTSEASWTVTLQDRNAYTFQCDRHASLSGNFTVGTVPAPVTTQAPNPTPAAAAPAPEPLPLKGALQAAIGPGLAIGLARSGKKVARLPRGIYELSISDRTTKDGLTLRQVVGGTATETLTAPRFVGRKTVAIALRPGKWKVYSEGREAAIFAFFDVT